MQGKLTSRQPEIILNLWYVCDDMGFIYSLRARAYFVVGTDEEKMNELQKHSQTDYLIARAFSIPARYHINGQAVYHKAAFDLLDSPVDLFREAINTLQNELPSQTPFDIPSKPVVCFTPLLGDDFGNIRPKIDEVDFLA